MKTEKLWVRFGDCSEYEYVCWDVLSLNTVFDPDYIGEFVGWVYAGLVTDRYGGNDYISLYWGDDAGEFIRELDRAEKTEIEELLITDKTANDCELPRAGLYDGN